MPETGNFIILPKRGLVATNDADRKILSQFPTTKSTEPPDTFSFDPMGGVQLTVRDTVAENGPKLVSIDQETADLLNEPDSPVRAVPEVFYPLPKPMEDATLFTAPAATPKSFDVEVLDATTSAPIAGCRVNAFTDVLNRIGASGVTGANGRVRLTVDAPTLERITAAPVPGTGYWSAYLRNVPAAGLIQLKVAPLVLPYVDGVRHYFGHTNFVAGTGVRVGVIDTGCGPHADLGIAKGTNTVTGEQAGAWSDWQGHGTHVAGLIGARGTAPNGIRGVAPGAVIHAYRVFGANARGASNYAILKAMIYAAFDKCDIINLSLGGGPDNDIVRESITDARNQGMLVVIAAGNDGRRAVSYPAAYPGATAVSALGREGTFPAGSGEELQVLRPPKSTADAKEFIAGFSNVGPEIAVTAPGVGAISTLPNNKIGPLSGTSMAAPVAAGAAACLLSQQVAIFTLPRNQARSAAIENLLKMNCAQRAFGPTFEGFGLPQSPLV